MPPNPAARVESMTTPRWLRVVVAALFVIGWVVRMFPLFDWDHRLLQTFPTEDGYFMLTVGRNMSLGLGMSVAGGEMPTNGVQPLVTFVWALAYALVGGDRVAGVFVVLLIELAVACGTAFAIYRLARRVLASRPYAHPAALLASAAWFASPVSLPHTMNCLETGAYALMATLVARAFAGGGEDPTPFSRGRALAVGGLLGVAFWVRNDAVFLILAACLTYVAGGWPPRREGLGTRVARTVLFGATSVVVASPWLLHNYLGFGHIMPISGRAESLGSVFGENLVGIPVVLFEVMAVVLPLPHALERTASASLAAGVMVLAYVGFLVHRRASFSSVERRYGLFVGLYTLFLAAFYGLYFGASWFLNRYVHPLSPLYAVIFGGLWMESVRRLQGYRVARALPILAASMVVLVVGLSVRFLQQTEHHPHFQVIRWVEHNVPDDQWVAAIQTGTLGYFHDRTINLDGKVNLEALEAQNDGTIGAYVASSPALYLVDWEGIIDYRGLPEVAATFDVLVDDRQANLGVLRRVAPAATPRSGEAATGPEGAAPRDVRARTP